jgi:hypothetical protein
MAVASAMRTNWWDLPARWGFSSGSCFGSRMNPTALMDRSCFRPLVLIHWFGIQAPKQHFGGSTSYRWAFSGYSSSLPYPAAYRPPETPPAVRLSKPGDYLATPVMSGTANVWPIVSAVSALPGIRQLLLLYCTTVRRLERNERATT